MKYNLDQLIYYILENKLHSAPVLARTQIENLHEDWAYTKEQKDLFTPFGKAGIYYGTCHGIIKEENCFNNEQDAVNSLLV